MTDLSKAKILVVDDAEVNIDILMEALGEDYDVSVALDGESALEAVNEDLPDLILLDILMPGIDGYEVCKKLKRDPKTQHIPVIFVTGVNETLQKNLGYELGCADYMTKPFEVPDVKARVKIHLSLVYAQREIEKLKQDIKNLKNG